MRAPWQYSDWHAGPVERMRAYVIVVPERTQQLVTRWPTQQAVMLLVQQGSRLGVS